MSPSDAITPVQHPERRYEIRRRRVRRKSPQHPSEQGWTPGDPRALQLGALSIAAGVVLAVMLACAVGNTAVRTPTVDVSGTSGVSVANYTDSPMRVYGTSLFPLAFDTEKVDAKGTETMGSLSDSRFVILFGGSFSNWPIHFWMGSPGE